MEPDFWHRRWAKNEISFHQKEVNPKLIDHFSALSLAAGSRLFVPLCGKTRDIAWLLSKDHRVVGAELSKLAIEQLFAELGAEPDISDTGEFKHYSAEGIEIYVGDIFNLSLAMIGAVDAVYDRAAVVALPAGMRKQYGAHIYALANGAPQLVITFEYDQNVMPGPPFSVDGAELARVYGQYYRLELIERNAVKGGLKGICPAEEAIWLLR